ncbi:MAG: ATP-binding protein [Cyanobacteria bacterium P01_H01_bin.21]
MITDQDWQTTNQHRLATALEAVCQCLRTYIKQRQGESASQETVDQETAASLATEIVENSTANQPISALDHLCDAFGLTRFERQVLLLCAGVELSAALTQLCGAAQGKQFMYPTFSLALAAFPEARWDALAPVAPLRRWRLIEMISSDSLTQSRLRIDERVLHYLTGVPYLDERLDGLVYRLQAPNYLLPSQQQIAQRMADIWLESQPSAPIIQLWGGQDVGSAIATTACQILGTVLYRLRAMDIPGAISEREALARLWEREAVLSRSILLLDCSQLPAATLKQTVIPFVESLQTDLVIVGTDPVVIDDRAMVHLELPGSSLSEQRQLWQQALNTHALEVNGHLDSLVSQFRLSAVNIQSVCAEVRRLPQTHLTKNLAENLTENPAEVLSARLWETCRLQTRPQLNDLAQRITPKATWSELVLPEQEQQMLREIAAQVRQQAQVYDTWAFTTRGAHGLGITVLFAGPSGTGKTLAAEVIAHELQLDLYRIDLSQVVNKYIGETEKNLRRVFDGAEAGGAILLFDEADALFGKRSDVKDARDRYANLEVSYLLQRMEAYRGLAILTTNLKKAIDTAFLRRLRFVVQFQFPSVEQRLEIWRRIFPKQVPTDGLDFHQLARLNITGGNIRNIALNASFLAADADTPVTMHHLLRAAKTEYSKLEKTLTDTEVKGWV